MRVPDTFPLKCDCGCTFEGHIKKINECPQCGERYQCHGPDGCWLRRLGRASEKSTFNKENPFMPKDDDG